MRRNQLRDEVGRALAGELARDGFVWDARRASLVRPREGVDQRILPLPVRLRDADFWSLDLTLALRFAAIEPLLSRHRGLEPDRQVDFPTYARDLINLYPRDVPPDHWRFRTLSDVPPLAPAIADRVRRFGLPFLERLSSVPGLRAFFEPDPGEWSYDFEMRAYLLLALYVAEGRREHALAEAPRLKAALLERDLPTSPIPFEERWAAFLRDAALA